MPDMQPSEMRDDFWRKVADIINEPGSLYISNRERISHHVAGFEKIVATHQRRAVIEGKIEELRKFEIDDDGGYYYTENGNSVDDRIAQLEAAELTAQAEKEW